MLPAALRRWLKNASSPLRFRPGIEPMEDRCQPAASAVRSIDGSGNNLANPASGQAGTDFLRLTPVAYADGVSAPAGAGLPSARAVSNAVADQAGQSTVNDRLMSAMVYAWGQFIDHDLDLTASGTGAFNIPVPAGDPAFDPTGTGTQVIPLTRSAGDPATGTSAANPRQQVNTITAWLDGSMVYGSDAATAASLRTLQGGKMKTSAGNLLPTDAAGFFQAGDARANENPELTALQTLFVREHNRLAAQFAKANPSLTDEQLYQKARAWVIAELQAITYNEWLPALLGTGLAPYAGYRPGVNPGISNEFATAGFRFGHSLVGGDIEFLDNNGNEVADELSFADAFFNPGAVKANGIDPLLKYLSSDPSQEFDPKVVDELRNMLVTVPGSTLRLDLAALNIQRGRDHGLADYNTTRAAFGLPRVTDFSQITSSADVQAKLRSVYGSVDKIDLWVGVLAEDHVRGGSVGPTARAIIVDQFSRLRAGDRFWYENTFTGGDLRQLQNTHLADVIERNTALTSIQSNPFFFRPEVTGTVTTGATGGKVSGLTVRLVNADGEVAATTTTDARDRFRFGVADGLGTGAYTIEVVTASGTVVAGPAVSVTSGDSRIAVTVALSPGTPTPPRPHTHSTTHHAGAVSHVVSPPMGFDLALSGTDLTFRQRP